MRGKDVAGIAEDGGCNKCRAGMGLRARAAEERGGKCVEIALEPRQNRTRIAPNCAVWA